MAIEINERFEVPAGLDEVWRFVVEPAQVVTCMPGAELIEQKNENTYLGKVKVKLGAINASYQGEVVFESIDEASRTLRLVGEGREPGGGTAKGTVDIGLHETASGGTEMRIDVQVDITGKVMQVGGGMIKPVSKQLFKQFANNARKHLESAQAAGGDASAAPVVRDDDALAVIPLLGRTLWAGIVNFFRRLFGRAAR
jgi:carbon monoxide dehydrogenase subunit G